MGKLVRDEGYSMAGMVRENLTSPLWAGIYVLGVAARAVHLSHGVRSAIQSLGVSQPHLNPWLVRACWAVAGSPDRAAAFAYTSQA